MCPWFRDLLYARVIGGSGESNVQIPKAPLVIDYGEYIEAVVLLASMEGSSVVSSRPLLEVDVESVLQTYAVGDPVLGLPVL